MIEPTPLDVDAYVRLLTRVAFLIERVGFDLDIAEMVGQEPEEENPPEDINLVEAEQQGQADGLRAIASVLPGIVRALQRIADPVAALQADADAQGAKLDGTAALMLARDATYLSTIARRALDSIDGRHRTRWRIT